MTWSLMRAAKLQSESAYCHIACWVCLLAGWEQVACKTWSQHTAGAASAAHAEHAIRGSAAAAQGLTGAIHETGHALYEQGRNLEYDGLPVNEVPPRSGPYGSPDAGWWRS